MITLNVNGRAHQYSDDENMPLLWALRDILNYTGTKYGCGKGLCGACTVHLNGQPVRSCATPVSAVNGQKITTIEGLSSDGDHPVQQAWQTLNVPQCGYCQSGQMMSAAALLATNPNPNDAQIEQAMSGNICRCGTYERIKKAIHLAADLSTSTANVDDLAVDVGSTGKLSTGKQGA
ncbi:(2Fe-2S)-binding protein [Thalassotalea euphylliae]|uniref:(2Fe-2S)-binding protein n=1 Tax=Thalassotalea euphylliae TaxID=1655234 RepID=A0A3E0U175_9GAMM|nr:(2Fe-2S)-binding protein [Thalassotalea euphylliae]REL30347.1 (2Fe-2S)-binding protein [Thalassotalea euphylliae]